MRFFTILGVIFYAVVLILIGIGLFAIAVIFSLKLPLVQPQMINDLLLHLQNNFSTRLIIGMSGILLILVSFAFAQLILGKLQREKTILRTGSGEVTVALSAVEDLIKRLSGSMPEIRELRPDVITSKKGILVDLRVILKSEANIPDLTARLQETIRSKIHNVLGIEEEIIVKIHIAKIISIEDKDRKRKEPAKEESTLPFGGYNRA